MPRFKSSVALLAVTLLAVMLLAGLFTSCRSSTDDAFGNEQATSESTAEATTAPTGEPEPDPEPQTVTATPLPVATTAPTETPAVPTEVPAPIVIERLPKPEIDPSITLGPEDPAVIAGALENGLRYFIRENDSPGTRAEFRLVVEAGSIQETEQQLGGAHFLEHMMFNGTEDYPGNELVTVLEEFGSAFGPDLNAYTTFDETVYTLSVSATSGRMVEALSILEQWAGHAQLNPEDVDNERGVVLEEWRLGIEGLSGRLLQVFVDETLGGTRYAERMPIGTDESILSITAEELRRFYNDWYRPERMSVVAVGDFTASEVEQVIIDEFSDLTSRAPDVTVDADSRGETREPLTEPEATRLVDPEMPFGYVEIVYPGPGPGPQTVETLAKNQRLNIAWSVLSARLTAAVARGELPAGQWSTGENAYTPAISAPFFGVQSSAEVQAELFRAMVAEIETARRFGFTEDEIDEFVEAQQTAFIQERETLGTRQDWEYADDLVQIALGERPLVDVASVIDTGLELLDDVSADAVTAELQELLATREPVVIIVGDDADETELMTPDEALALLGEVRATELDEAAPAVATPDSLMSRPAPGDVVSRAELGAAGALELVLDNGATVIIKPSDIAEGSVSFAAVSPGGFAAIPAEDVPRMRVADGVVAASGLGPHDVPTLDSVLRSTIVSLSTSLTDDFELMSGKSSSDDIEDLLAMVHLTMTAPRADATSLALVDDQLRPILVDPESFPSIMIESALAEGWFGTDPRFQELPTEADLDAFDIERDLAVWADRFDDPGDFTFVIVGDIDSSEVEDLVTRYIGSIPATGDARDVVDVDLYPPMPPRVQEITVESGSGNQGAVHLVFGQPRIYSDQTRFGLALLQEAVAILLRDELRERLSATYSPVAHAQVAGFALEYATFTISVSGDPERVGEIESAALDILRSVATDGIPRETYDTAAEVLAQRYELQNNEYWINEFTTAALFDQHELVTPPDRRQTHANLRKADVDALGAALFNMNEYISVTQIPES